MKNETGRSKKPAPLREHPRFWINLTGPGFYMGPGAVSQEEFDRLFCNGKTDRRLKWNSQSLSAHSCGLHLKWRRDDANGSTIVDNGRRVANEREWLVPGGGLHWTCTKDVREGDLSLFYRNLPAQNIRYLLLATKTEEEERTRSDGRWKFYHNFVVVYRFQSPLSRRESEKVVTYPSGGTAFSVDAVKWRILNEMLAKRNPPYLNQVREEWGIDVFAGTPPLAAKPPVVIPAGPPEPSLRERESGAGFGDAESNKETEEAAMKIAADWYEKRGWRVEDYSNRLGMGYDLHCTRGGREKHVEVKGISGDAEIFNMTAKEKQNAHEDDNFVVFVVTRARSGNPRASRYTRQQFARKFRLEADRFKATPLRTD